MFPPYIFNDVSGTLPHGCGIGVIKESLFGSQRSKCLTLPGSHISGAAGAESCSEGGHSYLLSPGGLFQAVGCGVKWEPWMMWACFFQDNLLFV